MDDVEIFFFLMSTLSKLDIENPIVSHIYDEDGPYFAFTKAEKFVFNITKAKE